MFVLYQGGDSFGAPGEECRAYLKHQSACNSPSSVFGCYRETINVTPPSVPSADHGTNDPIIDGRDQKYAARRVDQSGQSLD